MIGFKYKGVNCLQLYLAATPDRLETVRGCTCRMAHVAYRVGADGHLHGTPMPTALQGGMMVLGETEESCFAAADTLCREILRSCLRRCFSGIVLDFPLSTDRQRLAFARQLERWAAQYRRRLYVPESYAPHLPQSKVLLCTALTSGRLQQRLEEAAAQYTPQRLALDLQRLAMDFPLPTPNGQGTPLSPAELQRRCRGQNVFFSEDLCARYFTQQQNGHTHFVLFDDSHTLLRKMALAKQLGIGEAFVMLPEVEDLLGELFAKKKEGEP